MEVLPVCAVVILIFRLKVNGLELPSVDRIIDGAPIDISEVPYMLSYMVNDNHACGAAIIHKTWGLTAAHCVILFVDSDDIITVRSGSNKHDEGGTVHNVTKLVYHEKYNDKTNDYDIAVFKVYPPFKFNDITQPVKLPVKPAFINTEWGLVAGWGYFIDNDPVLSETLQYVILPKISRDSCVRDYENRYEVTERQVCYGFQQGGKDSCKGDSGGPLVNNFIVIGITSWGFDCGEPDSPGVYTNVIDLVDWIKSKITS
ncbi:trypsin 5G1 isoform X2 [Calliopsis andreniformis]|uniref:trypsin 5G1 isoform X2 n=1 Tax=Calliopsis andreniformis TaxID=337506 RepID=UPI003FCDD341